MTVLAKPRKLSRYNKSVGALFIGCDEINFAWLGRNLLRELPSAAPAALAFGLLLRKLRPARLPAARIPGAWVGVLGEFGQGVGHGWSLGAGVESVGRLLLIDADAAGFDNPKFAFDGFVFERAGQRLNETEQIRVRGLRREAKDGDAGIAAGKEDERIGKIEVERDEAAAFRAAMRNQIRVAAFLHPLLRDGRDIMTRGAQDVLATLAEVFVELEFHAAGSSGTVT